MSVLTGVCMGTSGDNYSCTDLSRGFLWMSQGLGPYATSIKTVEKDIKDMAKKVNDLCGKPVASQHVIGYVL